ncbi:MAG: NAD(P)-binding domain-containing protein [Bacteroidales bacterium]|nr:NAD(P)-binding domain-containing protein [Bacteroidales bacterium]
MNTQTTQLFAVTGKPILHSKSPDLFNAQFKASGKNAAYLRIMAKDAEQAIFLYKSLGLNGMNVTSPYKETMLKLVDFVDESARAIGGINTIVTRNGALHGYNTDYYGVTQSFVDAGIDVRGKKCVVIGAGGAAKAAIFGMQQAGAQVTVVNRTAAKARKIAKHLSCSYAAVEDLPELLAATHIIISALPQYINVIRSAWLTPEHIVFDANYKGSVLTQLAEEKHCRIVSANDWLLNQAVMAYKLFFDEEPDKEIMRSGFNQKPLSELMHTISTIGLMGAGKTSHGKVLAQKLGCVFKDIDDAIVEKQQQPITEIFATRGEDFFRQLEYEELSESFNAMLPHIISCGGGIVLNEKNREMLHSHSIVVWLYASPEAIMARTDTSKRPLLQVENPLAKLHELLNARKGLYAHTAHLIVSTERKQKGHTANKIIKELQAII